MENKMLHEVFEYIKLIVIVVVITTILNTLVFTFSTVKQSSMEKTLFENDILIIEKISMLFSKPVKGDIIILVEDEDISSSYFKKVQVLYEDMANKFSKKNQRIRLVKRVIGVPGDVIDIRDGFVYINTVKIDEPYVEDLTFERKLKYPVTVPEDAYFVLGDNRDVSNDSRAFGMIKIGAIEGKVIFRLAPFNSIGVIK